MFRKSVSIDLVEPVVCLRGEPKDKQIINILRGVIRLQLSRPALVHEISLQFIGVSKTLWPEDLTKNNKKAQQQWDKHVLVDSVIPITKNSLLLKKGTHAFPFELLLSNALSESIECGLGHIRYKLHCQVHITKMLLIKSILKTEKNITLMRIPNLDQQTITQTHAINPFGGQLTLNIEKGHLVPGTLLPITFNFNHACSVQAVDQISVKLIERQKYKAPSKSTTRILHHEIGLSQNSHSGLSNTDNNGKGMHLVYAVPGIQKLKVHSTTSHPNIKVRHWIQIYLRLILQDGTMKELQIEASILVLLSAMDDFLTLPLYDEEQQELPSDPITTTSATVSHALSSTSISSSISSSIINTSWLKSIYPIKQENNQHDLMLLITAPPPLYVETQ